VLSYLLFFFYCSCAPRDLLSFPTRRSSDLMDLGKFGDSFNMTVLALRMTGWRNGVSHLHGRVTRRMWQVAWPNIPEDQIPITSRSEEHTSELQSPDHLVCRLLLEKKKKQKT